MKLWIVGEEHPRWAESGWGIVGVFDDEAKAKAALRTASHSMSEIEVNRDYGDSEDWPQRDGDLPK